MYTDQAVNKPAVELSAFQNLYERLEKAVSFQREGLSRIENKLHEILNLRTSQPGPTGPSGNVGPSISDFNGGMQNVISELENNNTLIECLFEHLCKIV